ncbi:MAG: arylsulfatase [Candidatus Pacebacteria bacterium]|nr:arylsulfatase [Candidatus Paceibacterota bacterium]
MSRDKSRHPNIVFFLADDMGYGDMAHFGNPVVRTPHLDRIAREGVTLTQHYSASSLCAPARAALLTGRYNHRTGAVDVPSNRGLDRFALDETTIADVFAAAGYTTGMVGKWHSGLHDMRYHPNNRGFQEFLGFLNGGMDYYNWCLDRNGQTERSDGRYLTDVFTDEAVQFVDRHREEPFFLYLAYNAPHDPLQAPDEMIQHYRDMGGLTEEVCRLYAMIEVMDAGIGKVLERLEEHGLADDTVVIFASDNGPLLGDAFDRYNGPFRGAKGCSLEGGIRVPGLVRWPNRLPVGTESDFMIHFCDWLPTLASMAGVVVPSDLELDGYDVTCRLKGDAGDIPDIRFWQRNRYEPVTHSNAAMRDGKWKLYWPMRTGTDSKAPADSAFYRHGTGAAHWLMDIDLTLPQREIGPASNPRLFDIAHDPGEEKDLAAEHPERVAKMRDQWDRWFEDVYRDWRNAREKIIQSEKSK